jgi:fucose 4-O-acetylase-like acetyltransferase
MENTLEFKQQASERIFMVRGIGIFLVVVGHVIGDSETGIRQLYPEDPIGLAHLYDLIYTFHMPIFFLAAGFSFTVFSQSNHTLASFLKSRTKRLLIPLLCWAPLYYLLRSSTGKVDFNLLGLIKSTLSPDFIFWFFPTIFFASVLGYVFLQLFQSWRLYSLITFILFVLSLQFEGDISTWFYFNSFYFIGCAAGWYLLNHDEHRPVLNWKNIWIAILMAAVMLLMYGLMKTEHIPHSIVKFINGLLGFTLFYGLVSSNWLSSLPGALKPIAQLNKHIFMHLGKISMSIYLLHVIVASTTRAILAKFNILEIALQLTIGLLVAILGSALIHQLLRKNYLFLYSIGEAK